MAPRNIFQLSRKPELVKETWALIERAFPEGEKVDRPVPLNDEFALLLSPQNLGRSFVLVEGKKVLAHIAYRLFEFQMDHFKQPLNCAGIGLVVTDPDHQKQGLGAELLAYVEKMAAAEGALLTTLWTGQHEFFVKQGYMLAGTELQWELKPAALDKVTSARSYQVQKLTNFRETIPLHTKQKIGPLRREMEAFEKLFRLPNTFAIGAYENKRLAAYAFVGKARDLRGVVHELIGDEDAVTALFAQLRPLAQSLSLPVSSTLRPALERLIGPPQKAAHAYIKVADPRRLVEWLSQGSFFGSELSISTGKTTFKIEKGGRVIFESPDPAHLLQLFFGPWRASEMSDLPVELAGPLDKLPVIPLYFWGFDSV